MDRKLMFGVLVWSYTSYWAVFHLFGLVTIVVSVVIILDLCVC